MNYSEGLKLLFIGIILLGFFTGGLALGQGLEVDYPAIPGAPPPSETTLLPEYIKYLYNFSIVIAGLIAFFSLVYGGFRYLISAGQPLAMADARSQITAGVIGLAIILASFLLLITINPQLTILKLDKGITRLTECDCSAALSDQPSYCKKICEPIPPRPAETSAALEIPIGTLIERLMDQERLDIIRQIAEDGEKLAEQVREKAKALKDELLIGCSCANVTSQITSCNYVAGSCSVGGSETCEGEPCDRAAVEEKKGELSEAIQAFKDWGGNKSQVLAELNKEIIMMAYASALLKESSSSVNSDNFFEMKQVVIDAGGDIEIEHFSAFGQTVETIGYDSATFYIDPELNKTVIEKVFASLSFGLPPENGPPPPPPNPDALQWPLGGGVITTQGYGCQNWCDPGTGICAKDVYTSCTMPDGSAGGWHNGLDLNAFYEQDVFASADGRVLATGEISGGCSYGTWVVVEHPGLGLSTLYAHLASTTVEAGDTVSQGDLVGYADTTGVSTGNHLHFVAFIGSPTMVPVCDDHTPRGPATNPLDYLP